MRIIDQATILAEQDSKSSLQLRAGAALSRIAQMDVNSAIPGSELAVILAGSLAKKEIAGLRPPRVFEVVMDDGITVRDGVG